MNNKLECHDNGFIYSVLTHTLYKAICCCSTWSKSVMRNTFNYALNGFQWPWWRPCMTQYENGSGNASHLNYENGIILHIFFQTLLKNARNKRRHAIKDLLFIPWRTQNGSKGGSRSSINWYKHCRFNWDIISPTALYVLPWKSGKER